MEINLHVQITNHRVINGDFAVYTVRVQGVEGSRWEVDKRYSSFDSLHDRLASKFKSAKLPKLPGKRFFFNMDEDFVHERQQDLQRYLQELVMIPVVGRSELVMMFLASCDTGSRPRSIE